MKRFNRAAFAAAILLTACGVYREEESSVTTEDGRYEAQLYRESTGALDPHYRALYLTASGTKPEFTDRSLYGTLAISNLASQGRIIRITYTYGNIYQFSSRWLSPAGDQVELRLEAQCDGRCIARKRGPPLRAPSTDAREPVVSVASPDDRYTAVLTRETSAPGEVSFYRLRIVPGTEAEEDAWKTIVLEAKGLEDPVLTWNPDAPIVLLSYTRGEIMRFHNVWIDEAAYTPGVDQDHIEIRLDPRCAGMCF